MDKKRVIIVLSVIILISIPIAFFGGRLLLSSNLEWAVDVGDEFRYDVIENGWEYIGEGITDDRAYFSTLDNAKLVMTIVALPELGYYYTAESFLEEVVLFPKVSIEYENGSVIPSNYSFLVNALSLCILPKGSWGMIDEFYQDSSELNMIFRAYFAKQETTVFRFGYHTFDIDLDTLIEGELSYETGIPSLVYYERTHGVDFEHEIVLSLLNA